MESDGRYYPSRKHPRLKEYDYSLAGYYFVTINTYNNRPLLSSVYSPKPSVGRRLASAAQETAVYALSPIGEIAEQQLHALSARYPHVSIDRYVIMPTHIHVILVLGETAEASLRPTLMDIVGAYKSLTTRCCNLQESQPGRKIFQASFYDTVIRNPKAYEAVCRYMDENPVKWFCVKEIGEG